MDAESCQEGFNTKHKEKCLRNSGTTQKDDQLFFWGYYKETSKCLSTADNTGHMKWGDLGFNSVPRADLG